MAWLADWYLWIKAAHVMSVIAWMAGIFYLPRLFVYHVEAGGAADLVRVFEVMERRLLKAIMTPAMLSTWIFGIALVATPGTVNWEAGWVWVKAVGIAGMTCFHFWLARQRRALISGECRLGGRAFRIMNEVPTLLMAGIVIAVIVKF